MPPTSPWSTAVKSDWNEYTVPLTSIEDGTHTIYLILKGEVEFDTWQMTESDLSSVDTVPCDPHDLRGNIYDLQGRRLPAIPTGTIYIRNGKNTSPSNPQSIRILHKGWDCRDA